MHASNNTLIVKIRRILVKQKEPPKTALQDDTESNRNPSPIQTVLSALESHQINRFDGSRALPPVRNYTES